MQPAGAPGGTQTAGPLLGFLIQGLGPESLHNNPDVASVGTSVEEPLNDSVAALERAQHLFGENPAKAQPTKGWSGAQLWGEVARHGLGSGGVIL